MKKEKSSCCGPKKDYDGKNLFKAISYALIPHIGCIAFIFAAILGTTVLMQFFKPLLMDRNIFYYLIAISVGFATMSSYFYLRKNNSLTIKGIKKRKSYLFIMYGSTVGVNIILFFFIFPFLANFTGVAGGEVTGSGILEISVNIPCPGHAPLISSELSTIIGVENVEYFFPNNFEIYYNEKTNQKEILSLEVFREYPAELIRSSKKEIVQSSVPTGICSGGCGGTSDCGGSCGSPSCSLTN